MEYDFKYEIFLPHDYNFFFYLERLWITETQILVSYLRHNILLQQKIYSKCECAYQAGGV